jgi:hypothetical protein
LIVNAKKFGAGAVIVGAMAVSGFGLGSGVASADESIPNSPGMWKLDEGDDWDGWDGEGRDWRGWDGPRYWDRGGACAWVPPAVSMWVPPAAC